jgi:hypothetical protein
MPTKAQPVLREIIKEEYKKCAVNPHHFMRKYCVIQHPIRGKINFNLYDFQADTLNDFLEHNFNIVLKARQIGLSTLTAGYSLWLMLFHPDKNVLVIATKRDVAKNLVMKVRVMHEHLPVWLRGECIEDNKLSLRYKNGSQIKAIASSPDAGRSEALSLLIMDEAAHIEPTLLAEEIWTAASSTLSTGGKTIILSTPKGMGNFFHKEWVKAKNGESKFNPIYLDWSVHPERDQKWRDSQNVIMGDREARQEHDADFIASGNTVVDGDIIQWYRQTFEKPPIEKRGISSGDSNYWLWEYPDYTKSYVVVADVARGDGTDKSAFQVIELESVTQVAEYKGLIGTKEYGQLLVSVATDFNDALLVIENSTVGWSVLQEAIDREYKNLFYMEEDWTFIDPLHPKQISALNKRRRQEKKKVAGFTTSVKTRPLVISKVDEYMRSNAVIIRSSRTLEELEVFIWKGIKAEAMQGYNDDLVMSLGIGLWVRDTALKLRQKGIELTQMAADKFQHRKMESIYQPEKPFYDPYHVRVGRGEVEDLRWLLDD